MIPQKQNSSKKSIILLFISVFIIAFFTSHGTMSLDPPARFKVAQSIVNHGDVQIRLTEQELADIDLMPQLVTENNGKYYSMYFGLGQTFVFVPFYYLFHEILGIQSDKACRALTSLTLFPLALASIAWIMFLLMREFDFTPRQSFITALLTAFATGLWETSKEAQDAIHLAFYFPLIAYGLRKYQTSSQWRFLSLSSFTVGMCFITRSDSAITIICYLIFASLIIYKNNKTNSNLSFTRKCLPFVIMVLFALPGLIIELTYNYIRFDHPISSYTRIYSWEIFVRGLVGLLFSPGKSLFLYNPIMLLAIPGFFMFFKKYRGWALYILAGFTGCLLLHAAVINFHGYVCWGPRYLTRYLPLLVIPAAFFIFKSNPTRLNRSFIAVIISASVIIQIAAVSIHYNRENHVLTTKYNGLKYRTMFEPEANFIPIRFKNIASGIHKMATGNIAPWPTDANFNLSTEQQLDAPVLNYLAFWPYHLTYYLPAVKPNMKVPLWASTLILISGLGIALVVMRWGWNVCPDNIRTTKTHTIDDQAFESAYRRQKVKETSKVTQTIEQLLQNTDSEVKK